MRYYICSKLHSNYYRMVHAIVHRALHFVDHPVLSAVLNALPRTLAPLFLFHCALYRSTMKIEMEIIIKEKNVTYHLGLAGLLGQAVCLLDDLVDVPDHVESNLGEVVVLAAENLLEARNRLLHRH